MKVKVAEEECQARRGLDYASAVFVSATPRHQQEVFDFCVSVGESFDIQWDWQEAGRSAHFGRCFSHPTGLRIEMTELDAGAGRNPGMTLFSIPGAGFYLQPTDKQMAMLWSVVSQDGFKWFSRLDFQNTELEPLWDAERVYQGVVGGKLWVKGHRSYEPRGDQLPDGSCPTGRTLYWGSARSERRCRTYDKAKQSGWELPAIRDEVQLRGDWAHSYGRELRLALRAPGGSAAMNASVEDLTVKALNQHLEYWELQGADPTTDKNWTRKAKPADWFAARIGKASEPLRKASRPVVDVDTSVDWGLRQYGRLIAVWIEMHAKRTGLDRDFVASAFLQRCYARLTPEDVAALGIASSEEELRGVMDWIHYARDEQSKAEELGWWAE